MARADEQQQAQTAAMDEVDFPARGSLGYLVRDTHRAFLRALAPRIAEHEVTIGMWFFLRALWEQDGLTQRELSQRVRMMEPTTATALDNMERRGLVNRVRNSSDRRKVNIHLTAKGRRLKNVLLPHAVEVNRLASAGVSADELKVLRAVLERMKRNLDEDSWKRA